MMRPKNAPKFDFYNPPVELLSEARVGLGL